jgi:hypothetical protein
VIEMDNARDTTARRLTDDRFIDVVTQREGVDELYPARTAFVAADTPDLDVVVDRNLGDGLPVAIIDEHGTEVLVTPEPLSLAARLLHRRPRVHVEVRTLERGTAVRFPVSIAGSLIRARA